MTNVFGHPVFERITNDQLVIDIGCDGQAAVNGRARLGRRTCAADGRRP